MKQPAKTAIEAERDALKAAILDIDWLRGHAEWLSNERDRLKIAAQAALDKPHAARTVRMLCAALAASEAPGGES